MVHPEVSQAIKTEVERLRKYHPTLSEEFLNDMAYNYVQAVCMADTSLMYETIIGRVRNGL